MFKRKKKEKTAFQKIADWMTLTERSIQANTTKLNTLFLKMEKLIVENEASKTELENKLKSLEKRFQEKVLMRKATKRPAKKRAKKAAKKRK